MRNKYLIVLLFAAISGSSQNFNHADHSGVCQTLNMVSINSKSFHLYLISPVPSCCGTNAVLEGRDQAGTMTFSSLITYDPRVNAGKVYVTADKCLIAFAGTSIKKCDTGGPRYKLVKLDTMGNVLWQKSFDTRIDHVLPRPNGFFFMIRGDLLENYDPSGSLVSSANMSLSSSVLGSCLMGNGNILVNYPLGALTKIRELDSNGTAVVDLSNVPQLTSIRQMSNGNFLGVQNGQVCLVNSSFSLLASTSTFSTGHIYVAYDFRNDTVFAAGQNQGVPLVATLNGSLQVIGQTTSNLESVVATGVCVTKDNKLHTISTGGSVAGTSHTFKGFFISAFNGSLNGTKDIGVTAVSLASSFVTPFYYFSPTISGYQCDLSVLATVKNYGSDTVWNYKLNFYSYLGGIVSCLSGLHQSCSTPIPPGGTVSVLTSLFTGWRVPLSALNANGSYDANICVYTSVPDFLNDENMLNNAACSNFNFETVGIAEVEGTSVFHVFPNPTSGKLQIKVPSNVDGLSLTDFTGRILPMPGISASGELDLGHLCDGIYIMQVQTAGIRASRKVVISH